MKRQKRIMILGGNYVQAMATKVAKDLGYYVISTDMHEDNPGHKIADEYCKIDIIDKDAVLKEAQRLKINGIIPFCSDTLAPIAAYVQEKMGLPGNPYNTVCALTHKNLFRDFLSDNEFLTPKYYCVSNCEEAEEAYLQLHTRSNSVIMKPTDASGSKGVTEILDKNDIRKYWEQTVGYSPSASVILEEHINSVGLQQDGDIFVVDGEIVFWGLCDQYKRPEEPFVPAALVFPSTQHECIQQKARKTVQEIITKIGFKQGPCNVEYLVDERQQVWILEIGPRNGGNLIPLLIEKSTGINLIESTIKLAVGDSIELPSMQYSCYAMTVVHRQNHQTTNLELITDKSPLKPSWEFDIS